MGGFVSGSLVLAVSILVATGPETGVASMAPTPQGTGLPTALDGDMGACAESGGPASSHQPVATSLKYKPAYT